VLHKLIVAFVLCAIAHSAKANVCPNAADIRTDLLYSTVSISTYEDGGELWFRGTGWFYGNRKTVVTAGHVIAGLSDLSKQKILIGYYVNGERDYKVINIERVYVALEHADSASDVAVLQLRDPILSVVPLQLADTRAEKGSAGVSVGYVGAEGYTTLGKLHVRDVVIHEHQLYKGNSETVLSYRTSVEGRIIPLFHGTSGAPVVNCEGKVIAMNVAIDTSGVLDSIRHGLGEVSATKFATNLGPDLRQLRRAFSLAEKELKPLVIRIRPTD